LAKIYVNIVFISGDGAQDTNDFLRRIERGNPRIRLICIYIAKSFFLARSPDNEEKRDLMFGESLIFIHVDVQVTELIFISQERLL